jgi:5-methyltetrahydropteroyltriglutamate--homocysteine methyltransferase
MALDFDAVGLDFVEGAQNLELLAEHGFPATKRLFAGIVNGKNIWINHYRRTLKLLDDIARYVQSDQIILSTSCSLLHVPYTVKNETGLEEAVRQQLAFAEEKLDELTVLAQLWEKSDYATSDQVRQNEALLQAKLEQPGVVKPTFRAKLARLREDDFIRQPAFA